MKVLKRVSFYYGTDPRNPKSSGFIQWLRKTGYEVVTKEVKYIKVDIKSLIHNERLSKHIDRELMERIDRNVNRVKDAGFILEQAKCNLDIEIALDIYASLDKYDSYILFSGDGDFDSIIKLARARGKRIIVVALRKFLAGELYKACDLFINLSSLEVKGLLY